MLCSVVSDRGAVTELDTIQVRSSANLHHVDLGGYGREAVGHPAGEALGVERPRKTRSKISVSLINSTWYSFDHARHLNTVELAIVAHPPPTAAPVAAGHALED